MAVNMSAAFDGNPRLSTVRNQQCWSCSCFEMWALRLFRPLCQADAMFVTSCGGIGGAACRQNVSWIRPYGRQFRLLSIQLGHMPKRTIQSRRNLPEMISHLDALNICYYILHDPTMPSPMWSGVVFPTGERYWSQALAYQDPMTLFHPNLMPQLFMDSAVTMVTSLPVPDVVGSRTRGLDG